MTIQTMSHQRGVSLIELMIAMVLSLLLMGAVLQFYLANKVSFTNQVNVNLTSEPLPSTRVDFRDHSHNGRVRSSHEVAGSRKATTL